MPKVTNEEPQVRERSADWLKARIKHLTEKDEILRDRVKLNAAEIKAREKELAEMKRSK